MSDSKCSSHILHSPIDKMGAFVADIKGWFEHCAVPTRKCACSMIGGGGGRRFDPCVPAEVILQNENVQFARRTCAEMKIVEVQNLVRS